MKKSFSFYFDILSLLVCIAGIVLSRFLMNFGMGMLVFRLLFIGSWDKKWENIKSQKRILLIILSFFFMHLIGLIWTDNIGLGVDEITRKLSFLLIPISIIAISPLDKSILKYLFGGFLLSIFVGTIWGTINYFSDPYIDPRTLIPPASHIRFSLNIALAILILIRVIIINRDKNKLVCKVIAATLGLWFIVYLILSQAMTGIVLLSLFIFLYIPYYSIRIKKKKSTIIIFSIYFLSILISSLWVYKEYNYYFTPNKIYQTKLMEKTPDGGKYLHIRENKHIENGNYLYLYYGFDEINYEWKKRTGLDPVKYRDDIVRYMNSISPYKDGKRFRELTDTDIENIKNKIGNKVYTERFSLRPRLYSIFLQLNSYHINGSFIKSSELQRIELWKNALALGKDNFLIGTGTGDIAYDFAGKLSERKSELAGTNLKAHNQYLYIYASFGIIGLIIFIIFLTYPPIYLKLFNTYIYMVFFFIVAISMLTEDTLDNLAGMMFFIFINSIMLFNSKSIKELSSK